MRKYLLNRILAAVTLLSVTGCADLPTASSSAPTDPAHSTTAASLQPGFYRGSATDPAVWLVHAGRKWLIPDPETFQACTGRTKSYWSMVRPAAALANVPSGGTIPSARSYANLHSGTPFVLSGTGTAYTITGCVKSGIPNHDVYRALYGDTDFGRVVSVGAGVFDAFPTASTVAFAPRVQPGRLIKGSGPEVRWVLHMGASLGIPSACAMESHGREEWEILYVSDATFNQHTSVGVLQSYRDVCDGLDLNTRYFSYSPYMASAYAKTWAERGYGSGDALNPWPDGFTNKCTFFVSQSVLAGFIRRTSARATYAERFRFKDAGWQDDWWFLSLDDRGRAFSGASNLFRYARLQEQNPMRPGIQFQFVTSHTNAFGGGADYGATGESRIWVDGVSLGDVIFFDWEADGNIDHVMMVAEVLASATTPYARIRMAGQSDPFSDRGLNVTHGNNPNMQVFIYRPTGYVKM